MPQFSTSSHYKSSHTPANQSPVPSATPMQLKWGAGYSSLSGSTYLIEVYPSYIQTHWSAKQNYPVHEASTYLIRSIFTVHILSFRSTCVQLCSLGSGISLSSFLIRAQLFPCISHSFTSCAVSLSDHFWWIQWVSDPVNCLPLESVPLLTIFFTHLISFLCLQSLSSHQLCTKPSRLLHSSPSELKVEMKYTANNAIELEHW